MIICGQELQAFSTSCVSCTPLIKSSCRLCEAVPLVMSPSYLETWKPEELCLAVTQWGRNVDLCLTQRSSQEPRRVPGKCWDSVCAGAGCGLRPQTVGQTSIHTLGLHLDLLQGGLRRDLPGLECLGDPLAPILPSLKGKEDSHLLAHCNRNCPPPAPRSPQSWFAKL